MKTISIIIPTFNEAENIDPLVCRIDTALKINKITYEIIFVDDNSNDDTINNIKRLANQFPIKLLYKEGKKGKAFSLSEGFNKAQYENLCMIDADLQYPPEDIPKMLLLLATADIVIANRKKYKINIFRKFLSLGFKKAFGKLMFNLSTDIQSGLKVFKTQVWKEINYHPTTSWAFDLEFLYKAKSLGFILKNHDITFIHRNKGESKINFLNTIYEIGINALKTKFKPIHPHHIEPSSINNMEGASVRYKNKKYITHTTLHHKKSAIKTFHYGQKIFFYLIAALLILGLFLNPLKSILILISILSFIYFIDVIFNLFIVWKSLNYSKEITYNEEEINSLNYIDLPIYSILCPLYKEAHVVPQFVNAIEKLDWPKEKLDVLLLLEEDDAETINKISKITLPKYMRIVIVPDSQPKTKPKACNYGLSKAKGEYLVIYDAEDIPDPLQLKKAYLGFQKSEHNTVCLQAKLNYYNPNHNLLTRLFTAEYSLWFDVSLTGLQSLDTSLPLGGTSNHFRVKDLNILQGWDPFNVTEDADLGVRLFKEGYKTAIIDSTTLEEANSQIINWIRQRSRWIKGYMQTYLVHTRNLFQFTKQQGIHSLYFNLNIGGKIAFILINPFLWLTTISYFVFYSYIGETIEYLYPSIVFYMAAISLVFGNFLFIYYYMIGAIKKKQWSIVKYTFFVPIYWILVSIAGYIALYQLLFKPHYWEKTIHGLHLQKANTTKNLRAEKIINDAPKTALSYKEKITEKLKISFRLPSYYFSGGILVATIFISNIINFIFNAYLGRELNYEIFGLVSLINSLLYFTMIPFNAINLTINNRSAFLEKRYGHETSLAFLKNLSFKILVISLITAVIWILSSPYLKEYFNTNDILPILLFTPIWLIGFAANANKGYLTGRLMFATTAALFLIEPIIKLGSAIILIYLKLPEFTYISIPLSVIGSFFLSAIFITMQKPNVSTIKHPTHVKKFPYKFFFVSLLSGLSATAFLSLDIILAKHFLSNNHAGEYALISLVGKIIFFLTTLFAIFIVPFVSQHEGERKNTLPILWKSLSVSATLGALGLITVGLFGNITIPILFGTKAISITHYLLPFTLATACFSLSSIFVSYYLAKKIYSFTFITFFLGIAQIILISIFHDSINTIVNIMLLIGCSNLFFTIILHLSIKWVYVFETNFKDFLEIFTDSTGTYDPDKKLRILIFNWRDTRHKWAGGAEVYLHEIAKRWVKNGNSVTIFCGNDGQSSRYQVIDNIQIVRRGGFYTVYFWAAMYYLLKFRGKFDIIVDSENGIPFLTPLFVKKPIILLIHHVHQEIFRKHLPPLLSTIATIIEGKIMPLIYKKNTIITVSESSRKEIVNLGFLAENIFVVHPGIENKLFQETDKTENPTISYLGRIKPYKNVDILIKAFRKVIDQAPETKLRIAGEGESKLSTIKLVEKLNLIEHVSFLGKVSEGEKVKLLGQSWITIQPSFMEGWGITVIEANACRTPVVASNVSGLKDSIIDGKTGILVPQGDINKFAKAILDIINSPKLRQNLSNEALLWSKKFSWDKSAKKFYEIILNSNQNNNEYKLLTKLILQKAK